MTGCLGAPLMRRDERGARLDASDLQPSYVSPGERSVLRAHEDMLRPAGRRTGAEGRREPDCRRAAIAKLINRRLRTVEVRTEKGAMIAELQTPPDGTMGPGQRGSQRITAGWSNVWRRMTTSHVLVAGLGLRISLNSDRNHWSCADSNGGCALGG